MIDEWFSGDVRQNAVTLEQGASKLDDWVILASRPKAQFEICWRDSIKMELLSTLW